MARRQAFQDGDGSFALRANGVATARELVPTLPTGPSDLKAKDARSPADLMAYDAGDPSDGDVLVAADVARLLRMNVKTVYDLARTGELPCWRLGRHFRFSRGAIVARLAECKAAPHRKGK